MAEHPNNPNPAETRGASREMRYLAFAVIPISIYALGMVILEQGDFGSMALESKLAALIHATKEKSSIVLFSEGRLRVLWLGSVLLYYCMTAAVILFCIQILRKSLTPKGFKQTLALWAVLSAIEIGHLLYAANHDTALGAIFLFTFDSLKNSDFFKPLQLAQIKTMVYAVNLMAAVAPFAIALAAAANLTPPNAADPRLYLQQLGDRSRLLKALVNLGSALLVAGVLHMQAWLRWPIAFVDDAKLANAMNDWTLALTTFIGCLFSLMIGSVYICCARVLTKRAEANLRRLPDETLNAIPEDWLDNHGFSSEPAQQISQILAILAPLLAGPMGAALIGLGGSAGH